MGPTCSSQFDRLLVSDRLYLYLYLCSCVCFWCLPRPQKIWEHKRANFLPFFDPSLDSSAETDASERAYFLATTLEYAARTVVLYQRTLHLINDSAR